MRILMLQATLHRACVTHSDVDYEGSCAIDINLMRLAGIVHYQQLHICNISNGNRFTTYAIAADSGSRIISINGAAAHKANPGDRITICTYNNYKEDQARLHTPTLVYLNSENEMIGINTVAVKESQDMLTS